MSYKYMFEVDEEIMECEDCPCSSKLYNAGDYYLFCGLNSDHIGFDGSAKPSWCPLIEVKDKQEKGDFVDGIYMP